MHTPSGFFSFPTQMDFGAGTIRNLPRWVQVYGKRVLLVTDPDVTELPLFATVTGVLAEAGIPWVTFTGIGPHPTDVEIHQGAAFLRREACDMVVGLGGGSALDAAKAIALMASHTGSILDYDDAEGGHELIDDTITPLIAIPTTAGTGSEVGRSTVVVDTERNVKVAVFSPFLMPKVAIIDPELHLDMPAWLTAATGLDALTHCVEALLARGWHPMADSIALGGIRLVADGLLAAHRNGSDLAARTAMAMAAPMGATACQKGLGVIHSLAHPCSTVAGAHHGLSSGVLLEAGLRFNRDVSLGPLARMARALGMNGNSPEELADSAIEWVVNLRDAVGVPPRLREIGVTQEMLPTMCRQAFADGSHQSNPRPVRAGDIRALYDQAF